MIEKPHASPSSPAVHFVAAALAAIVTAGIFTGVTALFLRDGWPLERLAAAARACRSRAYVSDREACMREWAESLLSVSLAAK